MYRVVFAERASVRSDHANFFPTESSVLDRHAEEHVFVLLVVAGVPVREIRGAVLRPFLESRMSIGANFLLASGYTGQTTETLALERERIGWERTPGPVAPHSIEP
jgi:hypothetical protein